MRSAAQNLLVVEDDRDVRESLLRVLSDVGYRARGVADGQAALDELRRPGAAYPALMLLDLRMPRMDGRRLQEEIARDPALAGAHIPVIVLSADSRQSIEPPVPGAVAVLAKPVRLERLLSLIASVVGPPAV
jgi:two-component system, OmpR family, response regulator MprA